jgi:hypothetical protein
MSSRDGSYEVTPEFREAKRRVNQELRDDLQRDLEAIRRDFPPGHSQHAVRIEDACCGHLSRTQKKYWHELLEPAPLSPQNRSKLCQRAINEAFQEIGACARSGGVHEAVESFRDELLEQDLALLEAGLTEDAMRLVVPTSASGSGKPGHAMDFTVEHPTVQLTFIGDAPNSSAPQPIEISSTETPQAKPIPSMHEGEPPATNEDKEVKVQARNWKEIEILFFNEHSVQITVGDQRRTYQYNELGMVDQRSGKPSLAWGMLGLLAEREGVLSHPPAQTDWRTVEKRMQEIRKWLCERFAISSDPLPYVKRQGYRAEFRIARAPSYRE